MAEGDKTIEELLPELTPELLVVDPEHSGLDITGVNCEIIQASQKEINTVSALTTPRPSLALFQMPRPKLDMKALQNELSLTLDGIQDPGNMGTIIRIADWFGIQNIICSPDTVDVFNPKVVQATMGALGRVNIHFTPLTTFLEQFEGEVYGTFLEGKTIYKEALSATGTIVMGNEGNGIREEIVPFIGRKLYIPPYPSGASKVESLNVGTATSIVCSEFRRRL